MLACGPAGAKLRRRVVWALARSVCWISCSAAGVLVSCQPKPAVELLQVSAVLPDELQFGDSFQVVGDGFALGSAASVRLSGSVHRAGHPEREVDLWFQAETESQRELGVVLPADSQVELAGEPEVASHATFRGDVQVAIAAKLRGEPPVTGTLHGAVLELYPASQTRAAEEKLKAEGERALEFFGVEAALAEDGLTVVRVAPGGRAAAAELKPGDRFLRADSVSVRTPSDLVPSPGRRLAVVVQRGMQERSVALDADGFSPTPSRAFELGAVLLGGTALALFFFASPMLSIGSWLAERWIEQRRARLDVARSRSRVPAGSQRRAPAWLERVGDGAGVLVWLAIGAALLSPALRRAPVDLALGLFALCFTASTLLAAAALVRGGRQRGGWSLLAGLAAVAQQCLVVAPAWVALLTILGDSSVDFAPTVAARRLAPWAWNAFSNPGLSLSFVLLLATALPRAAPPHSKLRRAAGLVTTARTRADDLFGWLYSCSTCAVAASAFLGGDAWPGLALPGAQHAAFLGALGLLVKYTSLVLLLLLLRRVCSGITSDEWASVSLWICLPLSVLAVALTHAFRALRAVSPFWDWIGGGFGPALLLALVVVAAVIVWRAAAARSTAASLVPWS